MGGTWSTWHMKGVYKRQVQRTLWNVRNFKNACTALNMTTVDVPGVTICQSLAILHIPTHCMFPIGEACRWEGCIHKRNCMDFALYSYRRGLILLFVQQYRALLTASECESDNGTVHAFCVLRYSLRIGLSLWPLVHIVIWTLRNSHQMKRSKEETL